MVTQQRQRGSLEVICGPMFSGKSEELIRRLRRAMFARQRVLTFKHHFDDRHLLNHVVSHNGTKLEAQPINDHTLLYELARTAQATIVGIDEIQFFAPDIITTICTLIDDGVRVVVAGLDLDFRGVPFGPMPTLLAIADSITKLSAICMLCGNEGHFTQRLVNGGPARYDDPVILVGAQEAYQARCRSCYAIDKYPRWG